MERVQQQGHMINAFLLLAGAIFGLLRSCRRLLLENLALRQKFAALKQRRSKSRLAVFDGLWLFV